MNIPHDAVGSDGYSVGIFQQQVRDTGNGWWWGDAATCMDPTSSAGLFYDRLARLDYTGPNSQAVQGSAFPDRYDQRFGEAADLYNRLVGLPPPPIIPIPLPPPVEGFLMALSDREQRALYNEIMGPRPSRSPLRHLGERTIGDAIDALLNTDGSVHVLVVKMLAQLGHPEVLALLREVAAADPAQFPDRQQDRLLAQAILADVTSTPVADKVLGVRNNEPVPAVVAPAADSRALDAAYAENARLRDENSRLQAASAQVVSAPNLPAVMEEVPKTLGNIVKTVVDAVEQLKLSDALSNQDYATLEASIKILEMKNGSK